MDEFEELESGEAFQWPRGGNAAERARMVEQVLTVQFPQAVRGYDREAVDRHMQDVRALVKELESSGSPDAAVQRAIEEISDETREVLLRAQQSAQEISGRARERAETLVGQAEREAEETTTTSQRDAQQLQDATDREVAELRATARSEVEELWATAEREAAQLRATARQETDQLIAAAEARVRELDDSAERLLAERRRLLGDMQGVADQLGAITRAESGKFGDADGSGAPATPAPGLGGR